MYSPAHYKNDQWSLMEPVIHEFPFAVLLTIGGEQVSHLPILLEKFGDELVLSGHMARANPHWRELLERGNCKVLFQGAHGYISPAWYSPAPDNVPTWNYVVVHVTGKFEVLEKKNEAFEAMDRLVNKFEALYETNWQLPRSENAIDSLMKGIVVFRISDLAFEGKFKLSQKEEMNNRENVITNLKELGSPTLEALAEKMILTRPKV